MMIRFYHTCLFIVVLIFLNSPAATGAGLPYPAKNSFTFQDSLGFFQNSKTPLRSRTRTIAYSTLGAYPISMYWLNKQWYQDYPQSSFHFFNDNNEWLQMDKLGHVWDAYSIAKPLMRVFHWAGYDNNKSTLYASGISFLYQSTLEVFDGFSSEWGFSTGDMISNVLGEFIFDSQQLIWQEQKITLKYSFHQTKYSKYRPALLGSNLPENILKDYNGLTYWLSVNPRSFLPLTSGFPKWISLAVGFGADGMTGGKENPGVIDGKNIPVFDRYRQFYIGIDFDLARIETRSGFLNAVFKTINIIHLPAPAFEINAGHRSKIHWLYF